MVALDVTDLARAPRGGSVSARGHLESTLKKRWHDELVAHPTTHAWVLNLYRAGEHHPATVDDYFPVAHAPAGLDALLATHRSQEAMHVRLYENAVARLGESVEAFAGLDVFNVAIREHTPARFCIDDSDAPDVKTEKLAHFLAHAHFLEARIARSLEHHVDACERAGQREVGKSVALVLGDEHEHARYTHAGVFDLLPRARALEVLDVHRRGEARANLAFSARQVRSHLARHPSPSRSVWRFCAFIMEEAVHRV